MNVHNKPDYSIYSILSAGATFVFFCILFVLSVLVLWIAAPTVIILGFTIAVFLSLFGLLFVKAHRKQLHRLKAISCGVLTASSSILVFMLIMSFISMIREGNREQLPGR